VSKRSPPRTTRRELLTAVLMGTGGWIAARAADGHPTPLPLITKAIPASGAQLPVVGLGTNAFSARTAEELAARRAVLQRLAQLGGKVVDTAAIYGESEAVIGAALASLGLREQLFLSTKVLASDAQEGKASMEESLRRLRATRVDLLEVHNLVGVEVMLPVLQEWKQAGRIRYLGITTARPDEHARLAELMRKNRLDFIQVDYSLGNRDAADVVLPLAQEKGIAVLANVPFGGRRGAASVFADAARRKLPDWAAEFDAATWGQFFLKYVVSHPAVTCAIPGTTDVAHLEDNLRGARGRLPDASLRKRMEQYWDTQA
jgi:aryl-alcohol dehydrogenase-like predicted oxidoreductase